MAKLSTLVYNTLFKRTSTFMVVVVVSTFFFERAFDQIAVNIYESVNRGKLWKDIKHKYE